jgi:hypothetical protein
MEPITFQRIKDYYTDHAVGFDLLYERVLDKAKTMPERVPFVELGTRCGGTALLTLWAIKESKVDRPLITVDPYGDKPYRLDADRINDTMGYGESFQRQAAQGIAEFCKENELSCWHYRLLDRDFMNIWDTIEIWYKGQLLGKKFGYAYLDAEHDVDTVQTELAWFKPRMFENGLIVIDDPQISYLDAYRNHDGHRDYISL